jgi:two-component system nitrogen regulation sensor histidine kinase NtrY
LASVEARCIVALRSMASNPQPSPTERNARPSGYMSVRPNRLPLSGRSARRLSFELRLKFWFFGLAVPGIVLTAVLMYRETSSAPLTGIVVTSVAIVWIISTSILFERIIRPLQTLSNVVAALREDDFSFRARGARRGDALGDLALEINALASTLQHQRSAALDALTLVEIVMNSMPSPVLAFDFDRRLRLLNPAAEIAFGLQRLRSVGRTAAEIDLDRLFVDTTRASSEEDELNDLGEADGQSSAFVSGRWSIYRTTFRLHGVPHALFVLADVSAALREEERLAWQRLIRVLGHEINNSLTPIKSIAGSLRSRLTAYADDSPSNSLSDASFSRGLEVIEDRAESLNRFLQAYQRLSRLPTPDLRPTSLQTVLDQVIQLEPRMAVKLRPGPSIEVLADADQLQQLFINLIRNAADAALSHDRQHDQTEPAVELTWTTTDTNAVIQIVDNGEGLLNESNLFVPFYTTKPGGTGIGLVLAQQIATAHDGSVSLRNRPDRIGCVAEVCLPLQSHTQ